MSRFFQDKGTLPPDAPSYLARPADGELVALCAEGGFGYVLAPRQTGKSSLVVRVRQRLRESGVVTAYVDLTTLGSEQVTPDAWTLSILAEISDGMQLDVDLLYWWEQHTHLTPSRRLVSFLHHEVAARASGPVAIFIDEIDSILRLSFPADDFFAALRGLHNARSQDPTLARLAVVLLGVAAPSDLIRDPQRTPFNTGQAIELTDLTPAEARGLLPGLAGTHDPEALLGRVLYWTGGHPRLTQSLCQEIIKLPDPRASSVDDLVQRTLLSPAGEQDETLREVHRQADRDPRARKWLPIYRAILRGKAPTWNPADEAQVKLRLVGLVQARAGQRLVARNRIYRAVFDEIWVRHKLGSDPWIRSVRVLTLAVVASVVVASLLALAVVRYRAWQLDAHRMLVAERETDPMDQISIIGEVANPKDQPSYSRQAFEILARHPSVALLSGHDMYLRDALFSPDGYWVATASEDGRVRAWPPGQQEFKLLGEHSGGVFSVAFSPDSQRLLTASGDQTARIWALNGDPPIVLRGHSNTVVMATFSPDGRRVLTASEDGTARLWAADGGGLAQEMKGHVLSLNAARFSPDGTQIVTASLDGTGRIWQTDGAAPPLVLRGHNSNMLDAVFSPDGQRVLSCSTDGTARLWSAQDGQLLTVLAGHEGAVRSARFSPDGSLALTASDDGTARLWPLSGPASARVLSGHEEAVASARFSPDGQWAVTASADRTARIWSVATGNLAATFNGHSQALTNARFSPDGRWVVTACRDKTARIWRSPSRDEWVPLKTTSEESPSAADVSPDGRLVVTASADGSIKVRNSRDLATITVLEAEEGPITAVAISPDNSLVAAGNWAGAIFLGQGDGGGAPRTYYGHTGGINSLAFSPDGQLLVSASSDSTARVWPVAQAGPPCLLAGHSAPVLSARFSSDGRQVVTASEDGSARLWTAAGQQMTRFDHVDSRSAPIKVRAATLSPDGLWVATVAEDQTIRLWPVDGKSPVRVLSDDALDFTSLAFNTSGTLLATATSNGDLRIWPTDGSGNPIRIDGHGQDVRGLKFSADERQVLTAVAGGAARRWEMNLDTASLQNRVKNATRHCLSPSRRSDLLQEDMGRAEEGFQLCRESNWMPAWHAAAASMAPGEEGQ